MNTSLVLRPTIAVAVSLLATACSDDAADNPATSGGSPTGTQTTGSGSTTDGSTANGTTNSSVTNSTANSSTAATSSVTTTGSTTSGATTTDGSSTTGSPLGGMTASTNGGMTTAGSTTTGIGTATTDGGTSAGGASSTATNTTGGGTVGDGPCDVYEGGGTPCVAAYSMIRRLASSYTGPLYQVRSGSSTMNTGSGGQTHDIGQTAEGFADAAAQDAACAGTTCTVSLLYDQSGNGNDIPVAKKGRSDGGQYGATDDFESIANKGPVSVGGRDLYSLYTEARQGYRSPVNQPGTNMPRGQEPQGIYMLADGTHYGTACCWDFGNVSPDPTKYGVMNTLFFGVAFWGNGAGNGPWFMADYEAGVWAGGTNPGDPGWGALDGAHPANNNNPSLPVPFAIGFLKTNQTDWSLRMADLSSNGLTTAYQGGLPKQMNNEGAIVLGVGGDNSNNSWGTFFEGAIVAGYPGDDIEDAVMQNVKALGYGQ